VDFGNDGRFTATPLCEIELVAGFPGQVARGLDAHLDVGKHETDVLVLNHRHSAGALVGPRELQRYVEGRAHHAHACRANEGCRPGEGALHHGNAIARFAHDGTWMREQCGPIPAAADPKKLVSSKNTVD